MPRRAPLLFLLMLSCLAEAQSPAEMDWLDRTTVPDSWAEEWSLVRQRTFEERAERSPLTPTAGVKNALLAARNDKEAIVRATAILAMARLAMPLESIASAVKDVDPVVRQDALRSLAIHPSQQATITLGEAYRAAPTQEERTLCTLALGLRTSVDEDTVTTKAVVSFLIGALENSRESTSTRVAAALSLGLSRSPIARQPLLVVSRNTKESVSLRAAALRSAARCGAVDTDHWIAVLEGVEPRLARAAAIALGEVDSAPARKALLSTLSKRPTRGMTRAVLLALSRHKQVEVTSALSNELRRNTVRSAPWAAKALLSRLTGDDRQGFFASLSARLAEDKNAERLAAYALMLAESGNTAATKRLRELTSRAPAVLRGRAAEALALLGDQAALPQLENLARQRGDVVMRNAACLALGGLARAAALETLLQVIVDVKTPHAVRTGAARGLTLCGHEAVVPLLTVLARPATPEVHGTALFALGRLHHHHARRTSWSAFDPETATAFPEVRLRETLFRMN